MKRIGIMGGSFNPVHIGHLIVADYIRQHADLDEIRLVLSPLNPLKETPEDLIDDHYRLEMLEIACAATDYIKPSDIELSMPRPSYTISTLRALARENPEKGFKLIIGSDNWLIFDRWKDSEAIIKEFGVIVYPRPGYPIQNQLPENVTAVAAPLIGLSSTFVRQQINNGYDMRHFLPCGVYDYIKQHNLYRQ